MRVYVQWAKRNPTDYEPIDNPSQWRATPKKPMPEQGRQHAQNDLDNAGGWVADLNCQGVSFAGADHFHVSETQASDGTMAAVITAWNDAPEQEARGERIARVWVFKTVAPEPTGSRRAGLPNTRQSQTVYAEPNIATALLDAQGRPPENTIILPWEDFAPPPESETRHGVWVADQHWQRHKQARTKHGWREWIE